MVRRLAGVSLVLALAGCSPNTTGTGNEANDNAGDDESGSGGTMESGEGADEQHGDGDPGCAVGSQGCPCTLGGGCDPGLACDLGVCVPGSSGDGDGDPTTGDGDGDPTTGDGDGDGDPNFMCLLDIWCDDFDAEDCVCEGCNNNGTCSQYEDCVCPDCTNLNVCKGSSCVTTGLCHPYFEGCECPDCFGHPLCT
jgi:hypothetical protein